MISCVYTLIFIPVGGDAQTNVAERLNLFDTTRGFSRAFDVRTDPGGDISLDRGYASAEMGRN